MDSNSFAALPLSPELLRAVREIGFTEMTEIQQKAIPVVLEGRDVIGRSSTGTGKTAAFGLPAVELCQSGAGGPQVLIMLPTRELALQVCGEMQKFSRYKELCVVPVYGGASIVNQINDLKYAEVVVGTPGRIIDHLHRGTLELDKVRMVVLDEADEMLNMGFLDDMKAILRCTPKDRQTLLFSATMPPAIMRLTERFQRDPLLIEGDDGQTAFDLISQYYCEVPVKRKMSAVIRLFEMEGITRALIFCNTKRMVDVLTESLRRRGLLATALHGDMRQSARTKIMQDFKAGKVNVLIATDVAARGIDATGVEAIINYDMPQDTEYYTHRIGRTGRAGKLGAAYTLVAGHGELFDLATIVESTGAQLDLFVIDGLEEAEADTLRSSEGRERSDRPRRSGRSKRESGRTPSRSSDAQARGELVALTLDVGSEHGISPNHIISALTDSGRVRRTDIGRIDIGADSSTVLLPPDGARAMLAVEAPIVKDFVVTLSCDAEETAAPTEDSGKKRRRRRRRSKKTENASDTTSASPATPDEHAE